MRTHRQRRSRSRGVATLTAIAASCALLGGVAIASAPPASSGDDLAVTQEAHFAVIDAIARVDMLAGTSQLGAIEGDPVAGTIDIGWVGEVPAAVQRIADEAAADGIAVRFVPQSASAAELVEMAQNLAAAMPADGAFSIGIGADELTVEVPTEEAAEGAGVEPIPLEGEVLDVIDDAEQAAVAAGASVAVEETDTVPTSTGAGAFEQGAALGAGFPMPASRSNDSTVLSGGMRVQTQFQNGAFVGCTSGFTGFYGHRPLIVTAAHCSDYADGRLVRNVAGTSIGRSDLVAELNDGARAYDLGVIAASYDARTQARIYTSESATVSITGTQLAWPPSGYRLCSSGQVTGWKCDLTAGAAYITCYGTPRGTNECMNVQIVRSSGASAFCLGDSGGPIVSQPTSRGAIAVGVVSGIKTRVATRCSVEGLIAPISQLMSTVPGLQLHTVPAG